MRSLRPVIARIVADSMLVLVGLLLAFGVRYILVVASDPNIAKSLLEDYHNSYLETSWLLVVLTGQCNHKHTHAG